jgi:hypothetical protein
MDRYFSDQNDYSTFHRNTKTHKRYYTKKSRFLFRNPDPNFKFYLFASRIVPAWLRSHANTNSARAAKTRSAVIFDSAILYNYSTTYNKFLIVAAKQLAIGNLSNLF